MPREKGLPNGFTAHVSFRLTPQQKEELYGLIQDQFDAGILPKRVMAPTFYRALTMAYLENPRYFNKILINYL